MSISDQISKIKKLMLISEQIPQKVDNTFVKKPVIPNYKTSNNYNTSDPNNDVLKDVNPQLKKIFYNIQSEYGKPLKVTYGRRSSEENQSVGGVEGSAHLDGSAIDIKLDSPCQQCIKKLVTLASKHGIFGIGVYKDADVIHLDIRRGTKRKNGTRVWSNKGLPIPDWVKPEISKHINK